MMERFSRLPQRASSYLHLPLSTLLASAALTLSSQAASGQVDAQAIGQENAKAGPRHTPAKVIPVPSDVDAATAALIAGPYSSLWNLAPPNNAAWRTMLDKFASEAAPRLAQARIKQGVTLTPTTIGGVKAYLIEPRNLPAAHRDQLVLHLHGGGYVFGQGESGTYEAAELASIGGYRVLSLDYRMPPEAPFPAALDDAVAAWRALTKTHDPRKLAVEGTSAGGGLTLALMLRLKQEKLPMPGAMAPGSPWSDLTETGDSYRTNEWVDNVLVTYDGYLGRAARLYAGKTNMRDPGLSPIYGDFSGLPPAILTAGTRDLFLSNTVRAHRKLREAGVDAELQVYEGLSHAQYTLAPEAPVTREIFQEITRSFDRHLAR